MLSADFRRHSDRTHLSESNSTCGRSVPFYLARRQDTFCSERNVTASDAELSHGADSDAHRSHDGPRSRGLKFTSAWSGRRLSQVARGLGPVRTRCEHYLHLCQTAQRAVRGPLRRADHVDALHALDEFAQHRRLVIALLTHLQQTALEEAAASVMLSEVSQAEQALDGIKPTHKRS
jgi:hypothetical protein